MSAFRAFFLGILFLNLSGVAFSLQASTPEAALEEMATADNLETLAKHLPVAAQEVITKLDAKAKEALAQKLLPRNLAASKGIVLRKSDDGVTWEITNSQGRQQGFIKVKNSFVSGTDAMVVLTVHENFSNADDVPGGPTEEPEAHAQKDTPLVLIEMELQEGEWRIVSAGPWERKVLRAEDVLGEIAHEDSAESAASAALGTFNVALLTYAATYPEAGLRSSLAMLSGPEDAEESSSHAKLLDSSFAAVPLIKFGYKFQYALLDAGSGPDHQGRYQITATPLEFGKSRSLFTDQTCVLRVSKEQRDANANDPPL